MRDLLKAAERETCGATYRNRIGGGAHQGERARIREALAIKERSVYPALAQRQPMRLTWGALALRLKGRRQQNEVGGARSQQRP